MEKAIKVMAFISMVVFSLLAIGSAIEGNKSEFFDHLCAASWAFIFLLWNKKDKGGDGDA